MRSKGSRFTVGVWGLRVCSLDVAFVVATVRNHPQPFATVRNRSQPSATVRNRSCEDRMAVPMVSSAGGVMFGYFWRFPTFRCFVSRGRRGTFVTFKRVL